MVRLKGIFPYLYNFTFAISIPYGAIKRFKKSDQKPSSNIFQFLMVRLKVTTIKICKRVWEISIPYGAIKRQLGNMLLEIVTLHFNSLWCD